MKQFVFVIVMILSMAMNAEAKNSGKNKELLQNLKAAVKNAQTSAVATTGDYRKFSFLFNGKTVSAFYDADRDELIGFSIPMSIADLSQDVIENIKARFGKYSLAEAIIFVRQNGVTEFYVSMSHPKKPSIVLSINATGKVHYFGKE